MSLVYGRQVFKGRHPAFPDSTTVPTTATMTSTLAMPHFQPSTPLSSPGCKVETAVPHHGIKRISGNGCHDFQNLINRSPPSPQPSPQPSPLLGSPPTCDTPSSAVEDGNGGPMPAEAKLETPPSSPLNATYFANHPLLSPDHAVPELSSVVSLIESFLNFCAENPNYSTPLVLPQVDEGLHQQAIDELTKSFKRIRYQYSAIDHILVIMTPPSPVHESPQTFISGIYTALRSSLSTLAPGILVLDGGTTMYRLQPDALGNKLNKSPDRAFQLHGLGLGRIYHPFLVVEVAYSESNPCSHKNANNWLLRSLGHVRAVIIVRFDKPSAASDFEDLSQWRGVLELWELSPDKSQGIIVQEVQFLPPSNAPLPPLILSIRHVFNPSQLHDLNLPADLTWAFPLDELVIQVHTAIHQMASLNDPLYEPTAAAGW